jgi:hypothetical protein
MSMKTFGHSLEKRVLRPFATRMRRLISFSGANNRIVLLEERVERLESLFREQAGLHYLRFAHDADLPAEPTTSGVPSRENE